MHVFDASSIIHAWDNYPIDNFPTLWEWLAGEIEAEEFAIPQVALEEVVKKSPDCGEWLKEQDLTVLPLTNDVLQQAIAVKHLLGIIEDEYHPKGVSENDIFIIATAQVAGTILISDEARQFRLPDVPAKYKIPAVCDLNDVNVRCIPFIDLIKSSGTVLG